jgi:copper(I)-binding protein
MHERLSFVAIGVAAAFGLAAALAAPALAQAQAIKATHAWARRAPAMSAPDGMKQDGMKMDKTMRENKGAMGGTSAVYVTLSNAGSQADALVSASTEAAQMVELHETSHDGGIMRMRPVKSIPVPAGGKTVLKPGGYHLMLMGLKHDLKPGDKVAVTLKFEHGGETRIEAPVK